VSTPSVKPYEVEGLYLEFSPTAALTSALSEPRTRRRAAPTKPR
jgi:hypothetical protein